MNDGKSSPKDLTQKDVLDILLKCISDDHISDVNTFVISKNGKSKRVERIDLFGGVSITIEKGV